ncbi:MAG TPA: response regulator [Dissulfurispiraceae bacterium]|nr:response regulator [Dissulfurispiraceae bacterium]
MAYKLMLADDSQTIQKVVEIVLNPEGFDIAAFNNGEDAVKALSSVMPDVVLADIEMPKMNGYKLCGHIKGNAATLHIPVILLAGAFEPFDENYAKSVGADEFILKPFESHELISKVKSLIVRHEMPEPPVSAEQEDVAAMELDISREEPMVAVQESQWGEGVQFDWEKETSPTTEAVQATVAESRTFDEELAESLQAADEVKEELTVTEEVAAGEISLEEISKMVKEAMGEPALHDKETASPSTPAEGSAAGIREMIPEGIDEFAADSVQYQADDLRGTVELAVKNRIEEILPDIIKESAQRIIAETLPNLFEEALRVSVKDISAFINTAINDEIRKVVPGLAETMIRREIEKITSELT